MIAPVERLAPILASPRPGPCIAFFDQDAGHVLAVDQHARKRAAIAIRRLRVCIRLISTAPEPSSCSSRCLARIAKRRSASHFACPISAASMPSSLMRSSSERMVSPSITINAAPMAARVVIKGDNAYNG